MDRPKGITILSILHIIGGIVTLGTSFLVSREAVAPLATIGITQVILYISILFLGALLVASGIGMWLGRSWGWWMAIFYVVYSIVRHANALRLIPAITTAYDTPMTGVETYYFRYGIRIVLYFFLLFYFYRRTVLKYFCLEHVPKWKSLGLLFVGTLGIFLVSGIISLQ